jgi:DNA repair exonuclease SbcCD nuclease subunit
MKFIHAADLHIDSPLKGLDGYAGAPVERLRTATRQAFLALVAAALERQVDLVVLAGDIFDGNWQDFRTGLFFREQLVRMTREGIRIFIAKGNHDAESQITRQLPTPTGVHVFGSRSCETVRLDELGVAVHGRSFPQRAVTEDFVPDYNRPVPGLFNIGVLHTSLTGSADHDAYAPTSVAALCGCGYDYFALGHIHARQVVQEAHPRIVFPGNLQGRHAREVGAKGCELVTVTGGRIESAEALVLDVVRWHQIRLELDGVPGVDALAAACGREFAALVSQDRDRLHAVRVILRGRTELHRVEAEQPGTLRAAVQAAAQDVGADDLWIEQVQLELTSPLNRGQAALREDACGEVIRLVDELAGDELALRAFVDAHVGDIARLPADLADIAVARLSLTALRQALTDGEASVLSLLGEDHPERPAA